jgi:hypothetical protein
MILLVCVSVYRELPRKQKETLSYLRKYHLVIATNSFGIQVLVRIIVSNSAVRYLPLEHIAKRAYPWKRSFQFYTICSMF